MSDHPQLTEQTFFSRVNDRVLIPFLSAIGQLFINLRITLLFLIQGKIDWRKVWEQTASIGFDSLPMTILICLISGSVLALQTAEKFALTGANDYVGGLVALAIVREIAPIFACLTVGARSGTAIAAELANMQITEQVAALEVMHVNPIRYLMLPRLIACVVTLPMLTFVGEVVGVSGGAVVAQVVSRLHWIKYSESVWLYLTRRDITISLVKAAIFGVILAAISCTVGLSARGGAREVGRSTTKAVVWTAIAMIIADFFLSWIFFGTSYDFGNS